MCLPFSSGQSAIRFQAPGLIAVGQRLAPLSKARRQRPSLVAAHVVSPSLFFRTLSRMAILWSAWVTTLRSTVEEPPVELHCGLCNALVEISGPFAGTALVCCDASSFAVCSLVAISCGVFFGGVPTVFHSHRFLWTLLVFSIYVACTMWRSQCTIAPCAPSSRQQPIQWRSLVASSASTSGDLCILCTLVETG